MPAHKQEHENTFELYKNVVMHEEKQNLEKYWLGTEIFPSKIRAGLSKNL